MLHLAMQEANVERIRNAVMKTVARRDVACQFATRQRVASEPNAAPITIALVACACRRFRAIPKSLARLVSSI